MEFIKTFAKTPIKQDMYTEIPIDVEIGSPGDYVLKIHRIIYKQSKQKEFGTCIL
jgi:hypothetical protein